MFKGINFKEFLNDHREWHAFVDGFGIVFCPFLLLVKGIRRDLIKEIKGELHYFLFGAFLGVIAAVQFWIGVYKVVF